MRLPRSAQLLLLAGLALPCALPAAAAAPPADRSGQAERGLASVIPAAQLTGVDPRANSVFSSTLPKGATARVTNTRNNRSTIVLVQDRIPAPRPGHVLAVSQRVADLLGMPRNGVATVKVAPLAVPQPDGTVRLGTGTGLAGRRAFVPAPPHGR
ncbi:septal ring lytic transglycosylase RlpA family protein [Roseomonas sp. NAR14]|uniref:Septal ring lytic transglycosylase RlpA family protein n=1 Tax=Roseomonas acroporae TaxID=2937791 RepID=A0A9X2BYF1_9PROT|nr:septal ring lytic transglycosylase RlpA family protein [Roseomonas acroporae]MCK8785940.1 septal ring lytic transglycosylase RlpA family protein [Roseomonas acroporae]